MWKFPGTIVFTGVLGGLTNAFVYVYFRWHIRRVPSGIK